MNHIQEMIIDTYKYTSELLGVKLGKIKEGYAADVVVVPYQAPTPINKDNIMGHLMFGLFRDFHPQHVFVSGIQVLENYQVKPSLMDEYNRVSSSAKACWDTIAKEGTEYVKNNI